MDALPVQEEIDRLFHLPARRGTNGGTIDIVKSGALKGMDAIFGMHVFSNFPVGKIGIQPEVGSEIVLALQTVVSRNATPGEMTVLTIGKFQSGEAANVVPETAELPGSVRTTTEATRKLVEAA